MIGGFDNVAKVLMTVVWQVRIIEMDLHTIKP